VADWWDTFFDRHYLATYGPLQPDEQSEAEALGAVRLAGCEPGALILDLPCGYGRHCIPLARARYRVIGADRSPAMLAEAARRLSGRAQQPEQLALVRADYRAMPFRDGIFDAALNLFTALGYLGDEGDRGVLREFHRVLRPDARLVIETQHRDRLARVFQERGWHPLPGDAFLVEERNFDPIEGMAGATHTLLRSGQPADARSSTHRVYTATEWVRMLRDAGFVDIETYGDLEGSPFGVETRLALVARKPMDGLGAAVG
jgi:SAM-dependent methyltransferase